MKFTASLGHTQTSHRLDLRCLAIVGVIFGYCYVLRLILVYMSPELVDWTMPVSAHPVIRDASNFWNTATLASIFLLGLLWAAGSLVLILRRYKGSWACTAPDTNISFPAIALLALTACVSGAWVALILSTLGIGIQGQVPETTLPFKLAGILVYLKSSVTPVVLLSCVLLFERSGRAFYSRLTAISMLFLGFLDMVFFDTRGAAVRSLLYIALLWWVAGFRLQRVDKILMLFVAITLPILIAGVTEVRLYGESLDSSIIDRLLGGINFLLFRVTGAEHLMAVVGLYSSLNLQDLLDVLTSPRGIPGYYTTALLGVDPNLPQTFAPSGLGWLYIFGGPLMIGFGGAIVGFLSVWVYNWLPQSLPKLGSAAKSLYILTLAMIVSEGSFEGPLVSLILGYATLWFLENSLKYISVQYHLNRRAS